MALKWGRLTSEPLAERPERSEEVLSECAPNDSEEVLLECALSEAKKCFQGGLKQSAEQTLKTLENQNGL